MMRKLFSFLLVTVLTVVSLLTAACDLEYVGLSGPSFADSPEEVPVDSEDLPALLEGAHYLSLKRLPSSTRNYHTGGVGITDGAKSVARVDPESAILVNRVSDYANAYIFLVDASRPEFDRSGKFYVSFSVNIDAVTKINVPASAKVLVPFTNGVGSLDVASLIAEHPEFVDVIDPIVDMETNGHYVFLKHLPFGAAGDNISALSVSDGDSTIGVKDVSTTPLAAVDGIFSNVYIPLVTPDNKAFTYSGSFYVTFNMRIDALTKLVVTPAHKAVVVFTAGRGTLDIEALLAQNPDIVVQTPDTEAEEDIAEVISSGSYIHFINLPQNVSKNSFQSVVAATATKTIARSSDALAIGVRAGALVSEAFVPLSAVSSSEKFSESGQFYISFTIMVDAVTSIIVEPSYAALYTFTNGIAEVDVLLAPSRSSPVPAAPHNLTIGGLASTVDVSNIAEVYIYNSAGIIAKCIDYTSITFTTYAGQKAAVVPLVFDNNKAFNGKPFNDSGVHFVSFNIYPDAYTAIIVKPENKYAATFSDGCAYVSIATIPTVPRNTLTITNLPANTQKGNIKDVFIWNQAGKVGQCQDYQAVEEIYNGLRIPLCYLGKTENNFLETGPYYISFDLNIDALTRYYFTEKVRVTAQFTAGNATLNASTLPIPPVLTFTGLPSTISRNSISNIVVYSADKKIAKCNDYNSVVVSSGIVKVPLVDSVDPKEYFTETGTFYVSFNIDVDVNTQIFKDLDDHYTARFSNGQATINLAEDKGYFEGELKNPLDEKAPVIKGGTIFEMNGGYIKVAKDTAVEASTFTRTSVVYVLANRTNGVNRFYYGTNATYNSAKKGYYSGNDRAIFKFVYLKDSQVRYVAKIPITESWEPFTHYTLSNIGVTDLTSVYTLDGTSNAPMSTYTPASEGWYILSLTGAGGGGGTGIDGSGSNNGKGGIGGVGGYIAELVYLDNTGISLYTGSGGEGGTGNVDSGNFQGNGAGGGGAGTFAYSESNRYLLVVGGGGGGGGASAKEGTGGGGGAGGSAGAGGGGGSGGDDDESGRDNGSPGGKGGGSGGGEGGTDGGADSANAGSDASFGLFDDFGFGAPRTGHNKNGGWSGGSGGNASFADYPSPNNWKNTNGANGTGGLGAYDGGPTGLNGGPGGVGGNNRNTSKGFGAAGGSGGEISDVNAVSAGKPGGAGSIIMYRVQ